MYVYVVCRSSLYREIIEGFAKRGMMFPRKFSNKKTAALVDKIGEPIFSYHTHVLIHIHTYIHTYIHVTYVLFVNAQTRCFC